MNSKDRDIQKLKDYANTLGLTVYFRPFTKATGGAEYLEGKYISIFTNKKTSKDEIILSLLHELGHHMTYLHTPGTQMSRAEGDALIALNAGNMMGARPDMSKEHRRIILQIERDGIRYMSKIHKSLKLEIEFWKVKHQQELDLFDYKMLYHKGRFSTTAEMKELYKKKEYYKAKYGKRKSV